MVVIFKLILLNKNCWILIPIKLKFVSRGLINNIPAFFSNIFLTPIRRQSNIWTNVDQVYRRIYASLGHDELSISTRLLFPLEIVSNLTLISLHSVLPTVYPLKYAHDVVAFCFIIFILSAVGDSCDEFTLILVWSISPVIQNNMVDCGRY